MAKALMVLPFSNNQISVDLNSATGWVVGSYAPPPPGTAPYVLVWLEADQSLIDTLSARSNCLFICSRDENGDFETAEIAPQQRNAVRAKINAMGFTGSQYGLLNAAIQSSQNRSELAFKLANKAFFRDVNKTPMTEDDVRGTRQGQ